MMERDCEAYALAQEKAEHDWHQENGEKERQYLEQIDLLLRTGTQESRERLLQIFGTEEIAGILWHHNIGLDLAAAMKIYELEVNYGFFPKLLDAEKLSIQRVRALLKELRFIIWRISFAEDGDAFQSLLCFIKENNASPIMVRYLLRTSLSYDKKINTLIQVSEFLGEQAMFLYTEQILQEIESTLQMQDKATGKSVKGEHEC